MITHIVLVKFKPDTTPDKKKLWREEVVALKAKRPEVKEIRFGNRVFANERLRQNDPGWEDGVVMTFDNMQELQTYAISPAHDEYLAATGHITQDKLIYDIESA